MSILGVLLIGGGVFAYTQLGGVTAPTTVNESAKINKNPIDYNYAICGVFDLQGNSDYIDKSGKERTLLEVDDPSMLE